jgi:hypothetical protein
MTITTTPTVNVDQRAKGRPVGTYTTDAGAQRRVWRQQARDGLRLVDVALNGRGRRYLIERAMTASEAEALAADNLTPGRRARQLPDEDQPRCPRAGGDALMRSQSPARMTAMADTGTHVSIEGTDYVVAEKHEDGSLVLRPDLSTDAMLRRQGARRATPEEFEAFVAEHGPLLPPDGEG